APPDRLVRVTAVRSDEPDRPGPGVIALECDASVVGGPARVHVVAGAVEENAGVLGAVDLHGEDRGRGRARRRGDRDLAAVRRPDWAGQIRSGWRDAGAEQGRVRTGRI